MIRCSVYDLGRIPYQRALLFQRHAVEGLQNGSSEEILFLLEHAHVVTLGRNVSEESLICDRASLEQKGIDIIETDRGGDITYHGPGQVVGYPIFKLESGRRSIRRYVNDVELVLTKTLADYGIEAGGHSKYRGVWTNGRKIASVGIRISKWITYHGFALNVNTDLSYFSLMNPCGITGCVMTSMQRELGRHVNISDVKATLMNWLSKVFGRELVPGDGLNEIHRHKEKKPGETA